MNVVGWNGVLQPAKEAVIPVMDHGFLYGMTLFETMRTYNGRPFLLRRHLERLSSACESLGISYELQLETTRKHIQDVMAANGLAEAYVRYTISAGENEFGLPVGDYSRPMTIVFAKPLPVVLDQLYDTGKPLQLLRTRRNSPESTIRFKSGHYMNNIIAKRELASLPSALQGAEGLMLNEHGFLTEGIVSNVLFIKRGELYTPSVDTGILPGITRGLVLELAWRLGIKTHEGMYTWADLLEADEVFMTTSVQELVPITKLIDTEQVITEIGSGQIGPITSSLLTAYRSAALRDEDE
ncbi:aminotransferase class IV [Paenibacillus sp. 481]|uniref:aminotransferase class IV n=1 Tax=Paenibacillus sp. 481 TaxID=2835869 RepID=UPI001E32E3E3|nr:aminotransferase class IV [Paenibacillus sp. 481]UHA75300.1 aminotransferase class IV [Paenibacillus sp. 481]